MSPLGPGRHRFAGRIAGLGSSSGTRVVIGRWDATPLGEFADAMVETGTGYRVLLAPHQAAAEFIAATYTFDEIRIEPLAVRSTVTGWELRSTSLEVDLELGGRTALGRLLHVVPASLAQAPAWCTVTDPVARLALRGVRTRGVARQGRREWYGATDARSITGAGGTFDGTDLGRLAPVDPPPGFGFSSTPRRPSVTTVVTTVEVAR